MGREFPTPSLWDCTHGRGGKRLKSTLFSPYLWVSLGSPCCMDQREEYNLAQNIHNIHYKVIYYQALPQLQLLSVTKKHIN